jgi:hypothetical protein
MQDRQPWRFVLVRRVGVPVGGALDAEPVDVAVLVDVGQPRHVRILGMAIVDERVTLRLAEAAPEGRQLAGPQVLLAEHQHGMARERALDPGQAFGVQRPGDVNIERLGGERSVDRTKPRSASHLLVLPLFGDPG